MVSKSHQAAGHTFHATTSRNVSQNHILGSLSLSIDRSIERYHKSRKRETHAQVAEQLRESYGTLASGRILYNCRVFRKNEESQWRSVKTFAQLRSLLAHAKAREAHFAFSLARPRPPASEWSPPGAATRRRFRLVLRILR